MSVLQSYCEGLKTPWHVDCDWSDEAHILRDLSVTSPKMFEDPDMIYKHFKTLYIRGRKVVISCPYNVHVNSYRSIYCSVLAGPSFCLAHTRMSLLHGWHPTKAGSGLIPVCFPY